MSYRALPWVAVAAGIGYLFALSQAMTATSYDAWGVLVVIPPLALIGVATIRFWFRGRLAELRWILYVGLAVKLVGAVSRYWVGFEAYEGAIDAERYHRYAVTAATDVWSGRVGLLSVFRGGTGTQAMEGVTALVYTLTGTSKMAGFVTFSFAAFLGTLLFLKAACIAVPGLARHRYAAFCILTPSLVYWPSSIGKDATLIFLLGIATYGIARLLSETALLGPLAMTSAAFLGAAFIRPHMVGIWLAGAFLGLLVALFRGRDPWEHGTARPLSRAMLLPVLLVAAVGLVMVSLATVRYLEPDGDETGDTAITSILDETTRRTLQAGSAFDPPSISNPANWPYASIRTLTRPLPFEAGGAAQLFVAFETTVFIGLCLLSWRRVLNVPKLIITYPYMAFAMTTMFLCGLAFTSFANLAILARQRSIVVPFMLLIVCVPPLRRRTEEEKAAARARPALREVLQEFPTQNSSMSPSVSAQFDSGGWPRSLTPRQVRTGPPPGSGTNDDDIWG